MRPKEKENLNTSAKPSSASDKSASLVDLEASEARSFLLKESSYCNFDLPSYITFDSILQAISGLLDNTDLWSLLSQNPKPQDLDDVNYTLLNNKDGKFAWRPFELIHPFFYVSLVHSITIPQTWSLIQSRFRVFAGDDHIECLSIPRRSRTSQSDKAELVSHWWEHVERASLELALDYSHTIHTDITDCYGSIYTHSIPWALHTKSVAKNKRRDRTLIGNEIDFCIQSTRSGQTNGISQGSTLMDFISEMVLGYIDLNLGERIQRKGISDYKILRYRDDYRVFVNNPHEGDTIIKLLTEELIDIGLHLNSQKTIASDEIILNSLKRDKWYWLEHEPKNKGLYKRLLAIYQLADKHPNSGSLAKALQDFHREIVTAPSTLPIKTMISIVTDIAFRNPRVYPVVMAILSSLLRLVPKTESRSLLDKLRRRFDELPHTGHLQIWLQRASYDFKEFEFDEKICRIVQNKREELWNSKILHSNYRMYLNSASIIDRSSLREMPPIITPEEVELFALLDY